MKTRNVIESIFGSSARIHILRVLFNSPQPLSGRQVGELSGLTHRGAIHAMESLVKLGAVKQRKVGRAYQYSLSRNNIFAEKIITPCIKAEAGLFDGLREDIAKSFGRDTISLVLYGSLARGEEETSSDIDVIAVVKDKRKKSEIEAKAASMIPYFNERFHSLLSLHCYTSDEIKSKKSLTLIKSVIKEGVLLYGKPFKELL